MPVPDDVREAMARAFAGEGMPLGYFPNGAPMRATTWADHTDQTKAEAFAAVDAALSALEAAGFEVSRKGTLEALALAAERLSVAATRVDRADTEFGFRVWADEARNAAGRAVVDLAAEPQFRITLSEEARAEIERLEHANAAAAANLGNVIVGSPLQDETAMLTASRHKEKDDG